MFTALFYQAQCCPLSPDSRHLLLSQGHVWITQVGLLSPAVCRCRSALGSGHGHHQAAVAHRAPHCGGHSRTRAESEISVAMCSFQCSTISCGMEASFGSCMFHYIPKAIKICLNFVYLKRATDGTKGSIGSNVKNSENLG